MKIKNLCVCLSRKFKKSRKFFKINLVLENIKNLTNFNKKNY